MRQPSILLAALAAAALSLSLAAQAENNAPNPYTAERGWGQLPEGRSWGSTSAIYPAPDGKTMWVADRCEQNSCIGKEDLDPIFQFDLEGNLLKSFGAGLITWPHGMFVDAEGNVWVTDARGDGTRGHQVWKFSPEGEVLMTLGTAGVAGEGDYVFHAPNDVLVAPDGSIFVADGHGPGNNNRIVKYDANGKYLLEWGGTGRDFGQFREPHALAMDSAGRLFVADRHNNRIQIFDQEGKHLDTWTQFSRNSGLFIKDDILYAVDSESNRTWGNNPGYRRGMRIGSVIDGYVDFFIPDIEPNPDQASTTFAEGVAVDAEGIVYGAEVGPKGVVKYHRPD